MAHKTGKIVDEWTERRLVSSLENKLVYLKAVNWAV